MFCFICVCADADTNLSTYSNFVVPYSVEAVVKRARISYSKLLICCYILFCVDWTAKFAYGVEIQCKSGFGLL